MSFLELFLTAVALSADAFAISLTTGLKMPHFLVKKSLVYAFAFGFFQALMPFLGYVLGSSIARYVEKYGSFIAFGILFAIGLKMLIDSIRGKGDGLNCDRNCESCKEESSCSALKIDYKTLLLLAISTSIDALAVGFSFSMINVNLYSSILTIGVVTFVLCFAGCYVGYKFGSKFKKTAEISAGIILMGIGLKILLESILK